MLELLGVSILGLSALVLAGILGIIGFLHSDKKEREQKNSKAARDVRKAELRHVLKEVLEPLNAKLDHLEECIKLQAKGTESLVANSVKIENEDIDPEYEAAISRKRRGRKNVSIQVVDTLEDHQVSVYRSIADFAKEKHLDISACRSAKYRGHLLAKRYLIS